MKAEIVVSGTELILGYSPETTSGAIARELFLAGVRPLFVTVVGDFSSDIKEALRTAQKRSELVILTGGLGTTSDDLTRKVLSSLFRAPLSLDERLREYDVGLLTGLNESEIKDRYPEIWHTLRQSPEWPAIPGEEGSQAFHQRIVSVLDDIRSGS